MIGLAARLQIGRAADLTCHDSTCSTTHMSSRVVTTVTAEIDGTVIARFANSEDAVFFVDKANEAGLFALSTDSKAHAYDRRGNMLCCPAAYSAR